MAKHARTILLPRVNDNIKEWLRDFSRVITREITLLWKECETPKYVDRGTDTGSSDFTQSSLTTDATWRDLDLSSIVPAGAVAVVLRVMLYDDVAGSYLAFRKNGSTNEVAISPVRTQVASVYNDGVLIVSCDDSRMVEYKGSAVTFSSIDITVLGWFI